MAAGRTGIHPFNKMEGATLPSFLQNKPKLQRRHFRIEASFLHRYEPVFIFAAVKFLRNSYYALYTPGRRNLSLISKTRENLCPIESQCGKFDSRFYALNANFVMVKEYMEI